MGVISWIHYKHVGHSYVHTKNPSWTMSITCTWWLNSSWPRHNLIFSNTFTRLLITVSMVKKNKVIVKVSNYMRLCDDTVVPTSTLNIVGLSLTNLLSIRFLEDFLKHCMLFKDSDVEVLWYCVNVLWKCLSLFSLTFPSHASGKIKLLFGLILRWYMN